MKDLKQRMLSSLSWSAMESVWRISVSMVVGIILARLLEPEQYGFLGMLAIFVGLGNALADSGFGAALMQKSDLTDEDVSSVLSFNVVAALLMVAVLTVAAPWIAEFYGHVELVPLVRVLSLVIIFNALGIVHVRMFSRRMDFKIQARLGIIAVIVSGGIGILMAWGGFGVWSLVTQQVSAAALRTLLLWRASPWRPSGIGSMAALRTMLPFGSRILAVEVVGTASRNLSRVLIGKLYSAGALGLFERGPALAQMPFVGLLTAFERVYFSALAAVQHDHERLRSVFRKIMAGVAGLAFPMAIGLIVAARPLVLALLTDKWVGCVPYLRIAALGLVVHSLQKAHFCLFKGCGRADLLLRVESSLRVCNMLALLLAAPWGILAMMWSGLGVSVVWYVVSGVQVRRLTGYRLRQQAKDLSLYAGMAAVMGAGVTAVALVGFSNPWIDLMVRLVVGVAIYGVAALWFQIPLLTEVWAFVLRREK